MAGLWLTTEDEQMLPKSCHYSGRMAAVVRRAEETRCFYRLKDQLTGCDHQSVSLYAPRSQQRARPAREHAPNMLIDPARN